MVRVSVVCTALLGDVSDIRSPPGSDVRHEHNNSLAIFIRISTWSKVGCNIVICCAMWRALCNYCCILYNHGCKLCHACSACMCYMYVLYILVLYVGCAMRYNALCAICCWGVAPCGITNPPFPLQEAPVGGGPSGYAVRGCTRGVPSLQDVIHPASHSTGLGITQLYSGMLICFADF